MNRTRRIGRLGGLAAAAVATLPPDRRDWGEAMVSAPGSGCG